ncbi:unnamed protein product [Cylindrotheca closterium]|uniref:Kinesin light chain n=1 Tax=Cylindrotheca closterium TaxID=2856 RepID=A0AAD2FNW2_9STRA|nr:unnamed protein product [Cylindrotheca closterium]
MDELVEVFRVQVQQRNYQGAREMMEELLEIQTKELGEDHLSVVNSLECIVMVLKRQGNLTEALKTLERVLEIQSKRLGENHIDTANTYKRIGELSVEQGDGEKAEEMFRKALDIKLEILPGDHAEVTDLYHVLSGLLQGHGKFAQAKKMQKVLLATLLQMHGEDHPAVVKAYQGIAGLLTKQNRLDDAIQMADKSIEICSRLQGRRGFDKTAMAGALLCKSKCLQLQGNLDGATELLTKLLVILKEINGNDLPTALTYEDLALAYVGQDMTDDAIKAYAKAIQIRKTLYGANGHPLIQEHMTTLQVLKREKKAKALHKQGRVAMKKAKGDSEKAMRLFREAMGIYEEIIPPHPNVDTASDNISALYVDMAAAFEMFSDAKVKQGLLEDAITASATALKFRRRTLGDDHIDTKRRMDAHRSLLQRLLENRG